jgi:hypothetical protein
MFKLGTYNAAKPLMLVAQAKPEGCTTTASFEVDHSLTTTRAQQHIINMSAPTLAPYILKRPWLKRWMMPLANWYANAAGYRRLGMTGNHCRYIYTQQNL